MTVMSTVNQGNKSPVRLQKVIISGLSMDSADNKKAALLVTSLGSFLVPFMGSSINIALPSIGSEFAMDAILLSWLVTSYLLSMVMFNVPFGRIADIYGRKKVFTYGISIFTASSLLLAISTSATMLIAFRILQGIGSAMVFGTAIAILTSTFPLSERGRVFGINVTAVFSGLSLGPFLGGLLTQHFGWRSIFLASVPVGLIIIVFTLWKLKGEWAEAEGAKFDFTGSVMYILTIAAVMYGLSSLPAIWAVGLILVGISGLWAFTKWEMRVESPIFDINLFRNNKAFTLSILTELIQSSATFAVIFLLSLYLQYVEGLGPQNAGLVLVSAPIIQAIFSPVAGRLSDKIEPRIVVSIGMALTVVSLSLFAFLSPQTTLEFMIGNLILFGFGYAFFASPNTNAVMTSVEKSFYGVASASQATMRQIGMVLSMAIATVLLSMYMGRVQITPEFYPIFLKSIKTTFIISAAICFAGIFASLARGKMR